MLGHTSSDLVSASERLLGVAHSHLIGGKLVAIDTVHLKVVFVWSNYKVLIFLSLFSLSLLGTSYHNLINT